MSTVLAKADVFGEKNLQMLRSARRSRENVLFVPAPDSGRPIVVKVSYEGFANDFTFFDFPNQFTILNTILTKRLTRPGMSIVIAGEKPEEPSTRITRLDDMQTWGARTVLVTRA